MHDFDPNDIGNTNNTIFGLPYDTDSAKVIFLPVPWEVTVSYNQGTAKAPQSIFNASFQVDLYDPFKKNAWSTGYAMADVPKEIVSLNKKLKVISSEIVSALASGTNAAHSPELRKKIAQVNSGCAEMNEWVKKETKKYLNKNKLIAVVGGEHSVPLGLLQSLSDIHKSFGILQIDAHADLREAYEGFTFSHASIMFNALKIPQIKKIVQIGIRDYCQDEMDMIEGSKQLIKTFFDRDIKASLFEGETWKSICTKIIDELPEKVYISFDVDGLDPKLCPCTGTPVPGGFELQEIFYLFEMIANAGKKIIGFDVCETGFSKNEWDENVAARILYRLANIMSKTNNI
jgi:agmatinase